MTYPVDTSKRFAIYSQLSESVISTGNKWPRTDGGEIQGDDPDHIWLEQVSNRPEPTGPFMDVRRDGWLLDLPNEQYIEQWTEVDVSTPSYDTGNGYELDLDEDTQHRLSALLLNVNLGLELGSLTESSEVSFLDNTGAKQTLTVTNLKLMLASYGAAVVAAMGL